MFAALQLIPLNCISRPAKSRRATTPLRWGLPAARRSFCRRFFRRCYSPTSLRKFALKCGHHAQSVRAAVRFISSRAFLPLINRMGPTVRASLIRPGFYPAGGGCIEVEIVPVAQLKPLDLPERGAILYKRGTARVAALPRGIAMRELSVLVQKMILGVTAKLRPEVLDEEIRPGQCGCDRSRKRAEHVTDVFTSFGERSISAETVAENAAAAARDYIASEAAVGEHLADQLLLPMALAGSGRFSTPPLSRHATTNIDVLKRFMNIDVDFKPLGESCGMLTLSRQLSTVGDASPQELYTQIER